MSATRPAPALDADFEEVGDQRRTERRARDRRAPRMTLDPMFAATLVNQIARREEAPASGYGSPWRGPRTGIIVNVRA
ncbi:hypothetical protein [Candidatus Viadribacter manganicus]|uniref:Uncharacterized protein n=1 Tax=Candidatus Viadribacter manganicus TaxID=1759059 RepID=A0A1B1AFA4_9PROT|nr:hypothetical protein [Candidatus Viadribacter manganicus]ANP45215.1 hypothetical protein ATE48_04420 [Candidatus Viadribacter manganicus]